LGREDVILFIDVLKERGERGEGRVGEEANIYGMDSINNRGDNYSCHVRGSYTNSAL
jgi:hypothetical protein